MGGRDVKADLLRDSRVVFIGLRLVACFDEDMSQVARVGLKLFRCSNRSVEQGTPAKKCFVCDREANSKRKKTRRSRYETSAW
jgi:hypothetical protein